jgi:hypothetical protein
VHNKIQKTTFLGCILFASTSLAAINIIGFTTEFNDRFTNDPTFFAGGLDLSGVGLAETTSNAFAGDDGGRWVTMVSQNAFVSANHFYPSDGSPVTFYQSNDPLGASFTTTIQSSSRVGATDIRIGVLTDPLPAGYAFYSIWDVPVTGDTRGVLGPNLLTFGRSPTNFSDISQDMAVGQNQFDIYYSNISVSGGSGDAAAMVFDSPGLDFESQLALGDSGAPAMVLAGGELTIVGVNWFTGSINGGATDISGVSYLPNYQTEIDALVTAYAAPIPEASFTSLGIGLFATLYLHASRRRQS